jgi:hypothetical protein
MPEMLTPAPGPAYVPPPTEDVKQADTVARTAYAVLLADLPPQMNETVTPFFKEAAQLIAAVGDAYFEAWRSFCTHTVDTAGAALRPDSVTTWLSLARQTVRSLGIESGHRGRCREALGHCAGGGGGHQGAPP